MKTLIFSLLFIAGLNSYSQEIDSTRVYQLEDEIKNTKKDFWKILATSSLAHFNGFSGLLVNPDSIKDPDTLGPLILFGSIGLALDIAAVVKICSIPKKKKELKALRE